MPFPAVENIVLREKVDRSDYRFNTQKSHIEAINMKRDVKELVFIASVRSMPLKSASGSNMPHGSSKSSVICKRSTLNGTDITDSEDEVLVISFKQLIESKDGIHYYDLDMSFRTPA
uniref:Uncharacterized protein n=1 Tax=Branchiostoma floridae TaxID=7739 RepID=C3YFQ0_BRAFL|eukprot:XP_002605003.1 hypothetical protein BRAFLDRAFT_101733 [Branchiostoma floridae]